MQHGSCCYDVDDSEICPLYKRIPLFLFGTPIALVFMTILMTFITIGILLGMVVISWEFLLTGSQSQYKF